MSTIVLDAGHGGYDPGAINGQRLEKDDNLRITKAVAARLKARGEQVILTRDSDTFVPLAERSAISNRNNADIFVSMHRNSSTNPAVNGVENFVFYTAPMRTRQYAENVLENVVNAGVQKNNGLSEAGFSVLRRTIAPSMLLELGFISNDEDNRLFDSNLNAYADAIAEGIIESLKNTYQGTVPQANRKREIEKVQSTLNTRYGAGLKVDGVAGPNTKKALVRALQQELNRIFGIDLKTDGVFGPATLSAIPSLRLGTQGNLVYLLQAALLLNGFDIAPDGVFGTKTQSAVRQYQQSKGLTADGIAGPSTFESLFRFR